MGLKYKHSSKTKAQWEALNPVIVENEIVIEKDTKRLKVGDGVSTYNSLIYITNLYDLNNEVEISLASDNVNSHREVGVIERIKLTLKRKSDNAIVSSIEHTVKFDDTISISHTELVPSPVKIEYIVRCVLYRKPTSPITHRVWVDSVSCTGGVGIISENDFELILSKL